MSGIPSPIPSPRGSFYDVHSPRESIYGVPSSGEIMFNNNNNNNNRNYNNDVLNNDVLNNGFIEDSSSIQPNNEDNNQNVIRDFTEVPGQDLNLRNDTLLNRDAFSNNSSDNNSDISSVSSSSIGGTSSENSIQSIETPPSKNNGLFKRVFSSVFGTRQTKIVAEVPKSAPIGEEWKCLCCTGLNNFVSEFCNKCDAPKGLVLIRYIKTSSNIVSKCYTDGDLLFNEFKTPIKGTKITISGYHIDGVVSTYKGSKLISKSFLQEAFRKVILIDDPTADKSLIENNVKKLCMAEFGSHPTFITCTGKPESSKKNKKYIFEFNAQNLLYVFKKMEKYVNYIIVEESTTTDNALSTSERLFDVHEENSLINYNKYMNELAQKARMMRILKAIAFFVFVICPLFRLLKFIFFRKK